MSLSWDVHKRTPLLLPAVAYKSRGGSNKAKQAATIAPDSPQQPGPANRQQVITLVAAAVEEAVVSAGGKVHVELKQPQVCNSFRDSCFPCWICSETHVPHICPDLQSLVNAWIIERLWYSMQSCKGVLDCTMH